MANHNTKLELTWIGKENRAKLEPRILLEDPEKSYHAPHRMTDSDIFDNRLIFGDNLLALKALEQEFTGKIKCIFIDPPYNTGSAFEHYDDGLEHSIWLSLMATQIQDADVLAKRDVAVTWCKQASAYTATYRGKPWKYVLIPHDAIAENMTLCGLATQFAVS